MTKKKEKQLLCEDNLRHNEYYGMQSTIDNLYQASANGEVFTDLMSVILQRENILLAYRNIKKNLLQLDSKRLAKVNNLRQLASMQPI